MRRQPLASRARARTSGRDSPDDILVTASRPGDRRAFEELYRLYRPDIQKLCARLVGDPARAEDLAQETFLRAFTHMREFQEGRGLWPWLSTIARHLCVDELRTRQKQPVAHDDVDDEVLRGTCPAPSADATLEEVLTRQERARLRSRLSVALSSLPSRDRRIVLLRTEEGWSYEEIARADGTTVDAVRNVTWRARRILRSLLREEPREVSALGLLPGIAFAIRSAVQRLRARVAEMTNIAYAAPGAAAMSERTLVALLAVAAVASTWFGNGARPPEAARPPASLIADPPASIGTRESAAQAAPLLRQARTPADRGTSASSMGGGPVRTSLETSPPREGGLGPSASRLRVEIVSPDGRVLFRYEQGTSCGGQGGEVLPQDGPVRVVC